jgi:IS30 family transposase
MPRPTKKIEIPWNDLKGIKTQLDEGKSHAEIGEYFGMSQDTISRRIKKHKDS